MTQYPQAAAPSPQKENILLGTLLALIAVPVGIVVWVVVWSLGYIAAIVAAGIAVLVMFLYRLGAKRISIIGVIIIAVISLGTVLLAFFAGLIHDYTFGVSQSYGLGYFEVLFTPGFINEVLGVVFLPEIFAMVQGDFWMSMLFGALGVIPAVIAAFQESRGVPVEAEQGFAAQQPAPESQNWGVESVAWTPVPGTQAPPAPSQAPFAEQSAPQAEEAAKPLAEPADGTEAGDEPDTDQQKS